MTEPKFDKRTLVAMLSPGRKEGWKECGKEYGYPACCIDAFTTDGCADTEEQFPEGPWYGTGYVPCVQCAPKCLADFQKFINENIAPKRIFPFAFPIDEVDVDEMKKK
jgi:hypothetical protein